MPTMPRARTRKRYVGIAKMFPDSRRPRRLAMVMRLIETKAISIRYSYTAGTTDWIWAMAAAVDTDTVMT